MKHIKIFTAAFGLLLFVSCKKMDLQQPPAGELTSPTIVVEDPSMADWKTVNNWSAGNMNTSTGEISEMGITKDISENGIVLVYTKDGNVVRQLPYSEKIGENTYSWFYQISDGKIIVSLDAPAEVTNLKKQQSFTYLILSANQLEDFESKGISAAELFQMSYDKAVADFKN